MSHSIRLRGPWEYEWNGGVAPLGGEINLPAEIPPDVLEWIKSTVENDSSPVACRALSLVRPFVATPGLASAHRVELAIAGELQPTSVVLNGASLTNRRATSPTETRWEITDRLNGRCELRLDFEANDLRGEFLAGDLLPRNFPEISLEIFEAG